MLDKIFSSVFESTATVSSIDIVNFLWCILASLILGAFLAGIYMYKSKCSKSFTVTLALLPAIVCVVIVMVNGNIGAGVAVAGAFSLVRFRSVPGSAKEICAIFLSMAVGLATGMGYIAYAAIFAIIIGIMIIIYTKISFKSKRADLCERTLRITIPEDLDYTDVFGEIFDEYLVSNELTCVRTTNLGSMYKLTYDITLKDANKEKEMIDKIRCRNGNLEVSSSKREIVFNEL